jgi:hypothetical protein
MALLFRDVQAGLLNHCLATDDVMSQYELVQYTYVEDKYPIVKLLPCVHVINA